MRPSGRPSVSAPGVVLLCALALGMPPPSADAQTRPPGSGPELTREEMQRRIVRGFEDRIVRELGLDEVQTERLRATTLEFRDSRRELMRERAAVRREIRAFAGGGGTDAEAAALLEAQRRLRAREAGLQRHEEERLLEFLTPAQVVRLHVLREDFTERIRRLESGERRPSPRRSPGFPRGRDPS